MTAAVKAQVELFNQLTNIESITGTVTGLEEWVLAKLPTGQIPKMWRFQKPVLKIFCATSKPKNKAKKGKVAERPSLLP